MSRDHFSSPYPSWVALHNALIIMCLLSTFLVKGNTAMIKRWHLPLLVSYYFCNKLWQTWSLKNINLLCYRSEKSKMSLTGLKSRCCWACVPSCCLEGKTHVLAFPASRGSLHFLACGPFFHLQGQQSCISLTLPASSSWPQPDSPILKMQMMRMNRSG